MIYKIFLDGVDIYEPTPGLTLQSPHVQIELEGAGSLEFTMHYRHDQYALPKILTSDVEVYEEDDLIWYGRVLNISEDMKRNKKVTCEGALSFFNDSVLRPQSFEDMPAHDLFSALIEAHNNQVPANRQFIVGEVTVDNDNISAVTKYDVTKTILENLRKSLGGYYMFRKVDGANVIDWYADLPENSLQPIEFGVNLVDLTKNISGSNIYTSIIPLGKEIDGEKVTISDANDGVDYLDSEAVETYGRITKVVEFSNISNPEELKAAGEKWLQNQDIDPVKIDCSAAELYYLEKKYRPFKMGQYVRVTSFPHLIDKLLPLTSVDISLDSSVKQISAGTPENNKITQMT